MWNTEKQPQAAAGYPNSSAIPTYPALPRAQESEGWCGRNQKNKPQSNSAGAAALIFISGGMSMVSSGDRDYTFHKHLPLSWFIACIVGAIIGAVICNRIQKKMVTCFSALLVTISGVLLVSDPYSYDAILASRYLNGFAVGLVFPLTFVLISEQVVKSMRGMIAASVESMSFSLGIFLQILYSYIWPADESFNARQMMGALSILWGFVCFIIAMTLQMESPLFYLARGQEELAIDTLRRLQRPFTITYETYELFDEHRRYLAESKEKTVMESIYSGLPALIKLCFYRSLVAMSFSYFLNQAFLNASIAIDLDNVWTYYIYGFLRWIGIFVTACTLDTKGRRQPILVGFFVSCVLAFAIGGLYNSNMMAVTYMLMAFQLFAGVAIASSSAYLSEAFPLAVKPYYIAFVFIVEMLTHILIIQCGSVWPTSSDVSSYFFVMASLSFVFFVVAIVAMPETKSNTLRECLMKFRKIINSGT